MRTREQEVAPLVNLSEISEIELVILKRMREFTLGEHRSLFHGSGFDFVGLRNWEAGDRFETIDWAQSSLNNFAPLVVRDFEQPSTAGVVVVADHTKVGRQALAFLCELSAIDTLVVDAGITAEQRGLIEQGEVRLVVAGEQVGNGEQGVET